MIKKALYRAIAFGAAFLVFWWIAGWFTQDPGKDEKMHSEPVDSEPVEQEISSFSIYGRSPKESRRWALEGLTARIIDEIIHLEGLSAHVIDKADGRVDLSSEEGFYFRDEGFVELIGNVRIVTENGAEVITEKAAWSQLTNEITSDSEVRIKMDSLEAVGTGAVANSDAMTAQLNSNVSVFMEPDTWVYCSGPLKVMQDKNRAEFYDDVVVVDEAGRLISDVLTVHFDPESRRISKVVAEGNVRVKRGKSYTLSEKAVFTESTESAKLTGRARVVIDPEQIREWDEMGGFPRRSERGEE